MRDRSIASGSVMVRGLAAALALVTCAWFAVGIRQSHAQESLVTLIRTHGSLAPAQAAHARHLIDEASSLNPDRDIDLLRAEVLQRTGDEAAATRLLEATVRAQPRDVDAWHLLSFTAFTVDRPLADRAKQRVNELVPPVPAAP